MDNPFSLVLEKGDKEGSASAILKFDPICPKCGMDLRKYRIKERPTIPRRCPNFICPKDGTKTEYTLESMYNALTSFHDRYPTDVLISRGINRLTFITTDLNKEDASNT